MKIVHVARQYYPSIGGVQTAVAKLCHYQLLDGHNVKVVSLDRQFGNKNKKERLKKEEILNGISIYRIPFRGPHQYAIAPSVFDQVRDSDIIHLHSSDFFLDYLSLTKPFHKKPIVLTSHGIYFHTPVAKMLKKIYFHSITRINLMNTSAVICVSQHDYDLLKKIAPIEKLHIIPNGVEFSRFSMLDAVNRDPNLLVSIGRLAENKGYDRLLKSFALVCKSNPLIKLFIVGPDQGMQGNLKGLCSSLGITDRVYFVGKVSDTDVNNYLLRANVWLSGAYYESFGIALLEAMAAGCLPVIQQIPAFEQLIGKDYEFLTNFDHIDLSANAIINALSLPEEKRQVLVNKIRNQASKYSWESVKDCVEQIYVNILEA